MTATRRNPLASTPIAAPMLFVKYRRATERPGVAGDDRTKAATIKGNVIPRRTVWGRINATERVHLKTVVATVDPSCGRIVS